MLSPRIYASDLDLQVDQIIGKGSFCAVYQCKIPKEQDQDESKQEDNSNSDGSMLFTSTTSITAASSRQLGRKSYALKRLQDQDELPCVKQRASAAADLAREVKIFTKLGFHDHIVKLHAVSSNFDENPEAGFIVLDRLHNTLEETLNRWRSQKNKRQPQRQRFFQGQAELKQEQLLLVRQIGLPIAKALAHLHGNKIIYRDLKPANVGFDYKGTVRLFDFGMARDLQATGSQGSKKLMTPMTGTLRYMSPEVMAGSKYYTTTVDVYAFALVLWEILTLGRPFAGCNSYSSLFNMVIHKEQRPSLRKVAKPFKQLIKSSWQWDHTLRPSFPKIICKLERLSTGSDNQSTLVRAKGRFASMCWGI
jgi:serine/threonine protein kinase